MQLTKLKILIAAQYAAPYEGNFIASLGLLANRLKDAGQCTVAYVLPKTVQYQAWAEDFISQNRVFLTGNDNILISENESDDIITEFNPSLIYTHFEGYDLPLYNAVRRNHSNSRIVWHMHDTLTYHHNPVKALYQLYCYFKHYGKPFIMDTLMGGV